MKKAILKGTAVVLAVGLIVCVVVSALLFDAKLTKQTETGMANLAGTLAMFYDPQADANVQATQFAKVGQGLRITIIAADGTVLGDSAFDYSSMENHKERAELKEASSAKVGIAVRGSDTLGEKMMYAAVRTDSGAYIRVATQYSGFLADLASLLPALALAILAAFVVAGMVATRFASSIATPIADLSDSLKLVKDGGASLDARKYPYEELQVMAGDINRMSAEIGNNIRRLESEKTKIDYILDNMNEGFVLLDAAQNILLINASASSAFRCAQDEMRGKNILHATRNIPLLDGITHVLAGAGHTTVELPLGEQRTGEAYISTVRATQAVSMEAGVIIIISDVTAQKNAVKMRQDFFESASHELKTPITSIKGFAELLCSGISLPAEKQTEISARILKETSRMSSLIGDIIMISRLESGDITFEREVLDLAAVVGECCADATEFARQNEVTLSYESAPCVISASRREMSELAGNLITNAIRYNQKGGHVDVCLTHIDSRPVLRVFNTGEPIPPEYRERIFERFYRIDKGRSKAAGGTGLGLAIVKHIATSYHAQINVSVSPQGNTFTVVFPPIQ